MSSVRLVKSILAKEVFIMRSRHPLLNRTDQPGQPTVQLVKTYRSDWGGYADKKFEKDAAKLAIQGWRIQNQSAIGQSGFRQRASSIIVVYVRVANAVHMSQSGLPLQPFQQSQPMPTNQQSERQPTRFKLQPLTKRSNKGLWIAIAVIVVIVAIIANMSGQGNGLSTTPVTIAQQTISDQQTAAANNLSTTSAQTTSVAADSQTPASQPTTIPTQVPVTPQPTVSYANFGDGTFQVGTDIQPGTYRTQVDSPGCYYARLSGFGGTLGEIIANNNTDNPAIVTIQATDKGFQSSSCGTWTRQ